MAGAKVLDSWALICCLVAKHMKADLYTGDREFREVEHAVRIVWI